MALLFLLYLHLQQRRRVAAARRRLVRRFAEIGAELRAGCPNGPLLIHQPAGSQ